MFACYARTQHGSGWNLSVAFFSHCFRSFYPILSSLCVDTDLFYFCSLSADCCAGEVYLFSVWSTILLLWYPNAFYIERTNNNASNVIFNSGLLREFFFRWNFLNMRIDVCFGRCRLHFHQTLYVNELNSLGTSWFMWYQHSASSITKGNKHTTEDT